jgi:hypothetical protein
MFVRTLAPWDDNGLYLNDDAMDNLESGIDSGAIMLFLRHGADVNASIGAAAGLPVWLRSYLLVFFSTWRPSLADAYLQILRIMMWSVSDFGILFGASLPSRDGSTVVSPWEIICHQLLQLRDRCRRRNGCRDSQDHLRFCLKALKELAWAAAEKKVAIPWKDIESILPEPPGTGLSVRRLDGAIGGVNTATAACAGPRCLAPLAGNEDRRESKRERWWCVVLRTLSSILLSLSSYQQRKSREHTYSHITFGRSGIDRTTNTENKMLRAGTALVGASPYPAID